MHNYLRARWAHERPVMDVRSNPEINLFLNSGNNTKNSIEYSLLTFLASAPGGVVIDCHSV
jgi:hypothetical protein